MQPPSNVEEVRGFLGVIGYMRQFIRNYSITAAPLTYLLRNKAFRPKKACISPIARRYGEAGAFHLLKEALTLPAVLAVPDWNYIFIGQTDASSAGVVAVLLQPVGREERVFTFFKTDSR